MNLCERAEGMARASVQLHSFKNSQFSRPRETVAARASAGWRVYRDTLDRQVFWVIRLSRSRSMGLSDCAARTVVAIVSASGILLTSRTGTVATAMGRARPVPGSETIVPRGSRRVKNITDSVSLRLDCCRSTGCAVQQLGCDLGQHCS
jgi:hypothetical protein